MSGQRQIKDVPSSALQLSIAWIFFFSFSTRKQDTCIIYSNERFLLFMGGSGLVIFIGHPAEHTVPPGLYTSFISPSGI